MAILKNLLLALILVQPWLATAQVNYSLNGNTAYVIASPQASGNVVIVSTVGDYPVVGISQDAFANCTSLTSVTMPSSITNIAVSAFFDCSSLTNVTIGNGVISIIGDAFYGCSNLTSVTIPASVTSIGFSVFTGCNRLTSILVATSNPAFSSFQGVLLNQAQTTLVAFPGGLGGTGYTIPNSVTDIRDYAFENCFKLTNVTLPNSVSSIQYGAFDGCSGLTNIIIPASVTNIEDDAFESCTNLRRAYFLGDAPSDDGFPGSNNFTIFQGSPAFGSGTAYYNFPYTSGWGTNYGGWVTPLVTLPYTFAFTTNNGAITITEIFGSPTNVVVPRNINGHPVTSIGDGAFGSRPTLANVTILNNVTNIGSESFGNDNNLTNIAVAPANPAFSSLNGILYNVAQTTLVAFPDGLGGNYTISNNVTSIGDYAFEYNNNLTGVTIPIGVTNIGIGAFYACSSLPGVRIPDNVTSLGEIAFYGCTSLASVTIPDTISNIGDFTFSYCFSLTNAMIANSVTNIGIEAFYSCSSLTSITFLGNAPTLDSVDVFTGAASSAKVYYYYGTTNWSTTYGGLPTVELFMPPQLGSNIGLSNGNFGFTITGGTNQVVTIQASTNLVNWQPIWTNTLTSTSSNFVDPQWKSYPHRFYRAY
ncbi:MAG TPA: leucine-rich repeat domain-containing protein [Verrucomicrobiae bacterium]|jgi:hypothetical protein